MARTKGMLNLSGNLEVNAGAPLDARTVVPTAADLLVASNFQYKYIGMPVTVQATGDMYVLTANDVTDIANWKPVGKTYTAGTNVSISEQNVISATDTTYAAGDGIDITNSVISVDEMASADMSEVIDPLPSIPTRYQKYSTDEQVVGEWIDGKPVYQKTIQDTSPTVSEDGTVATKKIINASDLPVDILINTNGILKAPIFCVNFDSVSMTNAGYYIKANWNIDGLAIACNSAIYSNLPIYVTIQYTKTTD